MTLKELVDKYSDKNTTIIRRKNSTLNFSIRKSHSGFNSENVKISIFSDELTINSKKINMNNIKNIYAIGNNYKGTFLTYLYVMNHNNQIIIKADITDLSDEDTLKLKELFEYFVFSNEKDIKKLTSNEYKTIQTENSYNVDLQSYDNEDLVQDEIIKKDDKKYILYEIVPTSYYANYSKKLKPLIYKSKYLNGNYIDVWIDQTVMEKYTKALKTKRKALIISLVLMFFVFSSISTPFFYLNMVMNIISICCMLAIVYIFYYTKNP